MVRALSKLDYKWQLLLLGPVALGVILGLGGFWKGPAWLAFWQQPGLLESIASSVFVGMVAPLLAFYFALLISANTSLRTLRRQSRNSEKQKRAGVYQWLAPILALPHVAFALGLLFLFSPSGWIVRILHEFTAWFPQPPLAWWPQNNSLSLMILVLVLKEIPFLLLMIAATRQQIPQQQWLRLSKSFGIKPRKAWWLIVAPALLKPLRMPLLAVIVYSLSVVDIAILVGPNTPAPLAVEVVRWQRSFVGLDQQFAVFGSLLLLILAAVLAWLYLNYEGYLERRAKRCLWQQRTPWSARLSPLGGLWQPVLICLSLGVILMLVTWSLTQAWHYPSRWPTQWGLSGWGQELSYLAAPLGYSLLLALLSASIALALTVLALEYQRKHHQRWPDVLVLLPLFVPQVSLVLGWGQLQAWLGGADSKLGSVLAVLISHCIFALPYAYLVLASHYRHFNFNYRTMAQSLGYSPWQAWWRTQFPLQKGPLLFAWAMAFSVSIAQYVPTLLLGNGRVQTLTTEAVALMTGSDRAVIAIYALSQALLPMLVFFLALYAGRTKGVDADA